MKKMIYFIITILSIVMMSCKKENIQKDNLVKTINNGHQVFTFFYNEQRKLIMYTDGEDSIQYKYYEDSIVAYETRTKNRFIFMYNTFRQIDEIYEGYADRVYYYRKIKYNGNGTIFCVDNDPLSQTDSLSYISGNAIKVVNDNRSGLPRYYYSDYNTNAFSGIPNSLCAANFGMENGLLYINQQYELLQNKNLLETSVRNYNGSVSRIDYTYEFDNEGRVSKSVRNIIGSAPYVETYTYY